MSPLSNGFSPLHAPKHEDLIYDVGLHRGEDTDFYLRKGFRVVAFEAIPENVAHCKHRFVDQLSSGQLTIVEGAIVPFGEQSRPPTVTFYQNLAHTNWGTVRDDWAEDKARKGAPSRTIEVERVDLKAVLMERGIPRYLKLDVEGMELVCLEVLGHFLERPSYVSLESVQTTFAETRGEIEVLSQLGYNAFQVVDQEDVATIQAPPFPAREGRYTEYRFQRGSTGLFGAELPGRWRSKGEMLRHYRALRLGCKVAERVIQRPQVPGLWRVEPWVNARLRRATDAAASGWYDTHARHSSVRA